MNLRFDGNINDTLSQLGKNAGGGIELAPFARKIVLFAALPILLQRFSRNHRRRKPSSSHNIAKQKTTSALEQSFAQMRKKRRTEVRLDQVLAENSKKQCYGETLDCPIHILLCIKLYAIETLSPD